MIATAHVTTEDVLNALVPLGPVRAYAHLVALGGDADKFFLRTLSRWMSMNGSPGATFEDFAVSFGNREVFFSPVPWASHSVGSASVPLTALWARLPVKLTGPRPQCPAPGVDSESAATMRAKLASISLPPTITIDEGDAVTGIWKLTAPLADLAHTRRLLIQIAAHLDGDRSMADLTTALVRIPGTRNTRVYPGRDVIVDTWEPERAYTVEQIEDWLSAGRKGG